MTTTATNWLQRLKPSNKKDRGYDNNTDLRWLKRIAKGDRSAFEQFYRAYQPRLQRYLYTQVYQRDMIDEVLNDVMFNVWKSADKFRAESKVSTWVFGIAFRLSCKANSQWSKQQEQWRHDQQRQKHDEYAEPQEQWASQGWLDKGLAQLPDEQRSVVELTYRFGYSYREIAEIMDCPENTVKTRMHHARKKLRQSLPQLAQFTSVSQSTDSRESNS